MTPCGSNVYTNTNMWILSLSMNVLDLGIYMSTECTFNFPISNLSKMCANLSGWIMRTLYTKACITLFKSHITQPEKIHVTGMQWRVYTVGTWPPLCFTMYYVFSWCLFYFIHPVVAIQTLYVVSWKYKITLTFCRLIKHVLLQLQVMRKTFYKLWKLNQIILWTCEIVRLLKYTYYRFIVRFPIGLDLTTIVVLV